MSSEPLYSDDGATYFGDTIWTEDGLKVLYDPASGVVISAMGFDEDGDVVEYEYPAGSFVDGDAVYQGDPLDAVNERLDRIEEQAVRPPPTGPSWEQPPTYEQLERAAAERFAEGVQRIERQRGTPLVRSEVDRLKVRAREDFELGDGVDIDRAWIRAEAEGEGLLNLDDRQQRQEWEAQRLADGERDQAGQPPGTPDPPRMEAYDLSKPADRTARALDRMEGRIDAADAFMASYDSTDEHETGWGGQYPGIDEEE